MCYVWEAIGNESSQRRKVGSPSPRRAKNGSSQRITPQSTVVPLNDLSVQHPTCVGKVVGRISGSSRRRHGAGFAACRILRGPRGIGPRGELPGCALLQPANNQEVGSSSRTCAQNGGWQRITARKWGACLSLRPTPRPLSGVHATLFSAVPKRRCHRRCGSIRVHGAGECAGSGDVAARIEGCGRKSDREKRRWLFRATSHRCTFTRVPSVVYHQSCTICCARVSLHPCGFSGPVTGWPSGR